VSSNDVSFANELAVMLTIYFMDSLNYRPYKRDLDIPEPSVNTHPNAS